MSAHYHLKHNTTLKSCFDFNHPFIIKICYFSEEKFLKSLMIQENGGKQKIGVDKLPTFHIRLSLNSMEQMVIVTVVKGKGTCIWVIHHRMMIGLGENDKVKRVNLGIFKLSNFKSDFAASFSICLLFYLLLIKF